MKTSFIRGFLALSVLVNLAFIGALLSTYFNNIYFKMWVDSVSLPIAGLITGVSALVGLLAGLGYLYEKIKQSSGTKIPSLRRSLTPLELLALKAPTLATNDLLAVENQ